MENSKNTKQLVFIAIIVVVIVIIGICVFSMGKKEETASNNITNVQQDNNIENIQEDFDIQVDDVDDLFEIEPEDPIEEMIPDSIETPSESQEDSVITSNPTK